MAREKLSEMLNDKGKRTFFELFAGTCLFSLIALIIGTVLCTMFKLNTFAWCMGILLGTLVAVFMIIHMYKTLEKAIVSDKAHAKTKTKLGSFIRMLVIVGAMIFAAVFPDYISLIGVLFGILSLKFSALMQPLIDIPVMKIIKKEE